MFKNMHFFFTSPLGECLPFPSPRLLIKTRLIPEYLLGSMGISICGMAPVPKL